MVEALGCRIVAGQYAVGSTLPPEPAMCESFGVSRTVVRESIKSLVAKGLLITGPKLGTRVLPEEQWNWFDPDVVSWLSQQRLSADFLRDLQELRRIVEPAAIRLAAQRASPQDLASIEMAFAGMKNAVENGGDYVSHDLRFHQGLLLASGNRLLVQMSKALSALLRTSFEISTAKKNGPAESLSMHKDVLEAVSAKQPDRAESAILRLIDGAKFDIEAVLASRRRIPNIGRPASHLPAH
ncbi:MAG: FadR family transcriptional regulator [Betaproteobacteria bacterium]|nr:FadR family transcriptional regulator [Betaproteobacteria bacterium]NBY06311.1 FadR family transcriptional regulator [Betaproteobacteria bacterium]